MEQDIILVEDNPDDLELTLEAFRMLAMSQRIKTFRDGVEVIQYLFPENTEEIPAKHHICLMLLDLNLPRMNGLQVLEKLRADPRTKTIPVVMLTSSGRDEDRLTSYGLGVNSYVRKPVDFDDFIRVAEQLKVYWTEINEPVNDDLSVN
ncbi:response regulator [Candidatus Venteria ishoeyi]|uniref:response regulator n=1 Tax=Candidatus Venteria ishoeyi TaxID=1899563 RepID=UPI0025A4E8FC|nr:response regulator [Candidatus Venteria ishoeyi]MDM8546920.1 response regulator [Candidatus Venteria ishoeyi]